MIEELQDWRHIWLYAKGHYARSGDIMTDLKVLVGHHAALKPEQVSDNDILSIMCEIAAPYLATGNIAYKIQRLFGGFIEMTRLLGRPLTAKDVVNDLLVLLSLVKTNSGGKVLINLGEPDYNLLPEPEK